jgi:hypothetical protein
LGLLESFGVSIKILELAEQVTWRKIITVCKVKENPYQEYELLEEEKKIQ